MDGLTWVKSIPRIRCKPKQSWLTSTRPSRIRAREDVPGFASVPSLSRRGSASGRRWAGREGEPGSGVSTRRLVTPSGRGGQRADNVKCDAAAVLAGLYHLSRYG